MTGILKIGFVLFMASFFTEIAQLHGCDKKKDDDRPVTSSAPPPEEPTGTLSLAITDAPADGARRVVVAIREISLTRAGSTDESKIDFDPPLQIDLLALQGLSSESLADALEIPAGDYEQLRLRVDQGICEALPPGSEPEGSFIELEDESLESLFIPNDARRNLKLDLAFTLAPDGVADYTIDFDLRMSVSKPAGVECHHLRPSMRLVDNSTDGVIRGTVDSALLSSPDCGDENPATGSVVYIYAGSGVTPDDIDGADAEPLTSERVMLNGVTGNYEYIAGFLPPGDYTVALTCQGLLDQPDSSEVVVFQQPADVAVSAGQTTTHDFTVAPLP